MNNDVSKRIQRDGSFIYFLDDGSLLEEIMTARFIWGEPARILYRNICEHVAEVFENDESLKYYLDEKNGYRVIEYPILRAGEFYTINQCLESPVKVHNLNMKRIYDPQSRNFRSKIISMEEPFDAGNKTVHIFSDICSASGSTMGEWTERLTEGVDGDDEIVLIYNVCILSKRSVEVVRKMTCGRENIMVIFVCWGGLFDTGDKAIILENGDRIDPLTILNLSSNAKDSTETARKLYNKFFTGPSLGGDFIPDIVGEAGDKTSDDWEKVLLYDLMEFYSSGINLENNIWGEKVMEAINYYALNKYRVAFGRCQEYRETLHIFLKMEVTGGR